MISRVQSCARSSKRKRLDNIDIMDEIERTTIETDSIAADHANTINLLYQPSYFKSPEAKALFLPKEGEDVI